MKKSLVAVATVAALGAATIPTAQAHDGAAPFVAGAVIGAAVVGAVLAQPRVAYAPPPVVVPVPAPVVYAPPPPVAYVPQPVVIARPAPVFVYSRYPGWGHGHWDRGYRHFH